MYAHADVWEFRGIVLFMINHGTRRRRVASITTRPIYRLRKGRLYQLNRTLRGLLGAVWNFEDENNYLPLPGIEQFSSQPSHYTDYAIPAPSAKKSSPKGVEFLRDLVPD